MPDMKDAPRNAGVAPKPEPRRPSQQGFPPSRPLFPAGYPDYFISAAEMQASGQAGKQTPITETANKPVLRTELLTTLAEQIACDLGRASPKMTMHQLRGFYQHVKLQEGALKSGRPFAQVLVELTKLKPIARERVAKKKIPDCFEQFIVRNVDKVKDPDAFLRGFVEHFQAVVAYCARTLDKSSR
jgi:CRISPR/Cas system CSM-associated protein Csm2 small subunit